MTPKTKERVIFLLMTIPDGVQKMSPETDSLVQTSLNAVWGIMTHFGGSTHAENPGPGDVFHEIGPIALPD